MTDESTTEDFAAATTTVIEEEDSTDAQSESVRYRVSSKGDSVSVSGRRLVHGHPDKHLQPDDRSREF